LGDRKRCAMKKAKHPRILAAVFFASLLGAAALASTQLDAAPAPLQLILPCEEEVVYGTVVVLDFERGTFGLAGTEYEFIADDPKVLPELDGLQVRMEVATDCSIRALDIIGDDDSLT
jgi:hypothetical protein